MYVTLCLIVCLIILSKAKVFFYFFNERNSIESIQLDGSEYFTNYQTRVPLKKLIMIHL